MTKDRERESSGYQGLEALIWSWGHNFRNKAVTLLDLIHLIRLHLKRPSPDFSSIDRYLDLMKQVVDEIAKTHSPFQLEQVSLNSLIKERVEWYQELAPYNTVSFQVSLDPKRAIVRANSTWLRRILDILIDNAVDAMGESAEKQIGISTSVDERGVGLSVSDTGRGIDERLIASLFKKPSTLGPGGEGRGLYIAQILADIYKGKIEVKDTGPTGTTIVVWLPLEE